MKQFFKYGITFLGLMILFQALLCLISLFPSEWIQETIQQSSEVLLQEGNRYQISQLFDVDNNNYTDAIIVNEAYSIDSENPFVSYMLARKNYQKGVTELELKDIEGELVSISAEGNGNFTEEYDPVRRIG